MSCLNCPLKSSDIKGGYIPNEEDLEKVKTRLDSFFVSGDFIFHTIQGEGVRLGRPITFIRLQKCNLKCDWCDAYYTWRTDLKSYYTEPSWVLVKDLYNLIIKEQEKHNITDYVKRVCFTGGEPMLQQYAIERWIKEHEDFEIEIETNGTIPLRPYLKESNKVFFNCSPKLENSKNSKQLRYKENVLKQLIEKETTCFKFVFRTKEDIDEVLNEYGVIPKKYIWLMPEGVMVDENIPYMRTCVDYIVEKGLNITPRIQNMLWDGAIRGV